MRENKKIKLIGVDTGRNKDLKPEYSVSNKDDCYGIHIYKDIEKKELKIEIMPLKKFINGIFPRKKDPTPKQIEEQKKRDEEWEKNKDKPVDTSSWVKPDEESIRDELIKNLALCELYKEDTKAMTIASTRADVCYSILHSHSPKNPQGLTNFAMFDCLEIIYGELGNKRKARYTWRMVDKVYEGGMDIEKMREKRKQWKAKQLDNMITVKK